MTNINEWLKEKKIFDRQRFIDTSSGKALLNFYNEIRQEARKETLIEINKIVDEINIEMMNTPNVHLCEFCDKPTEKGASHYVDIQYKKIKQQLKELENKTK